ncbi:MAG: site-2 protease family protein [Armatimonadota bacterium]|nr:site-2 protease family protein [Armatimonadota bacterium]
MSLPETRQTSLDDNQQRVDNSPWSSTPPVSTADHLSFDLSSPQSAPQPAASPRPASEHGPFETTTHAPPPAAKSGVIGVLIAIGALLLKFKTVIVALLLKGKSLLALAKFGKIFTTMSSMLLSIGVYATLWGWKFATGFVVLLLIHEMGHVLVAWRKKLPVSAPMFIPFMGAFIALKQLPKDALTEAHISYGGPALGAVGCTLAWGCYYLTGHPLFLAVASVSMMLNLFNLVPVEPLDGGGIVAAISPRIWLLGLIVLAVWTFVTHNPLILLILVVGAIRLAAQWKSMGTSAYYKVAPRARLTMTLLYIGLVLYLAWGHSYTHHLVMDVLKSQGVANVTAL